MRTQDLIDLELQHSNDNLNVDDAVNQPLRERMLARAVEAVQMFWDGQEWDFKYKSDVAVSLLAGAQTLAMPADFHTLGYEGGLWIPAQQHQILEQRLQELLRRKRESVQGTGIPEYFAITNLDTTTRSPKVEFERQADSNYTVAVTYIQRPPLLVDRPAAPEGSAQTGSTLGVGTYQYRVTFVTPEGETDGGLIFEITLGSGLTNVALSNIPLGPSWAGVTGRKIYRTIVNGSTFKLLATATENLTTAYTDSIADGSLGADLAAGFSGLELIPAEYHVSCIQEGMIVLDARDKGDMRSATELEARWRKNCARAWANRQIGREKNMRLGDEGLIRFRMH